MISPRHASHELAEAQRTAVCDHDALVACQEHACIAQRPWFANREFVPDLQGYGKVARCYHGHVCVTSRLGVHDRMAADDHLTGLDGIALPDLDELQIPAILDFSAFDESGLPGDTSSLIVDDEAVFHQSGPSAFEHLGWPLPCVRRRPWQRGSAAAAAADTVRYGREGSNPKGQGRAQSRAEQVPHCHQTEICVGVGAAKPLWRRRSVLTARLLMPGVCGMQTCLPTAPRAREAAKGGKQTHRRGHGSPNTVATS